MSESENRTTLAEEDPFTLPDLQRLFLDTQQYKHYDNDWESTVTSEQHGKHTNCNDNENNDKTSDSNCSQEFVNPSVGALLRPPSTSPDLTRKIETQEFPLNNDILSDGKGLQNHHNKIVVNMSENHYNAGRLITTECGKEDVAPPAAKMIPNQNQTNQTHTHRRTMVETNGDPCVRQNVKPDEKYSNTNHSLAVAETLDRSHGTRSESMSMSDDVYNDDMFLDETTENDLNEIDKIAFCRQESTSSDEVLTEMPQKKTWKDPDSVIMRIYRSQHRWFYRYNHQYFLSVLLPKRLRDPLVLANLGLYNLSEMIVAYTQTYGSLYAAPTNPSHLPLKAFIDHAHNLWNAAQKERDFLQRQQKFAPMDETEEETPLHRTDLHTSLRTRPHYNALHTIRRRTVSQRQAGMSHAPQRGVLHKNDKNSRRSPTKTLDRQNPHRGELAQSANDRRKRSRPAVSRVRRSRHSVTHTQTRPQHSIMSHPNTHHTHTNSYSRFRRASTKTHSGRSTRPAN